MHQPSIEILCNQTARGMLYLPSGCHLFAGAFAAQCSHLTHRKIFAMAFTGGLHQSAQIFPNGLEFGTDGFEASNHLDVSVDNSSLVAFDHVAGSLQGHAAFFH